MIGFFYLLTFFGLVIYSFSQIDLNLTLFHNPHFLAFQNLMIQLGYFNRPLSTTIFVVLIFFLFALYFLLLRRPSRSHWLLVLAVSTLTLLAYPAFSHDVFNYMFDARIVTSYHQNPYFFRALDFPADPWIRFMHWTHRTFPYGPVWLLATTPLSVIGLGKFVPTLLTFKLFFVGVYFLNTGLIKKIAQKTNLSNPDAVAIAFALNPLVLNESLVSPHIDSLMAFFLLLAIYFWVKAQRSKAALAIIFSIGVKFVPIIIAPLFILKRLKFEKLIVFSIVLLLIPTIIIMVERGPYPWYFLSILALVYLVPKSQLLVRLAFATSVGATLTYAPYLFVGSYPPQVIITQKFLLFGPVFLLVLSWLAKRLYEKN